MRFNEEFCWDSWYLDWTRSKDGSVLICSWFNCFNGYYHNILQLHSFLLLNCFNGFASHLEFWPCFHGCLCTIKEEDSSQSCCSQPLCSRGLGDGNIIPCSISFLSRHNGAVFWRLGRLQFEGGMHKIPDGSCIGFLKLDNYCYFLPDHVLASCSRLGFSLIAQLMHANGCILTLFVSEFQNSESKMYRKKKRQGKREIVESLDMFLATMKC